ncbi:MAG: stage 0 sporulation protein J [Firmicutes bacterium HGW-Firmicutes-12]|nr:MAG: stage 0 sporulation protein J [Firmicutes bacterium HGW-Firmicutes-12]
MSKNRLGKGLSALIPTVADVLTKVEPSMEIEISQIKPNAYQPRRTFDEEKLQELVKSIKEHGVVQPIMVRPLPDGGYELVVGERRLRACQQLKLEGIPAVVKELTDQQMIEIALIENIQRHDLNPVEEASAYKRLMEEFNLTQEQVAERVGKSRPLIANMIRLLNLPQEVLDILARGDLSIGHVRPLLALMGKEKQINLARQMIEKNMSARNAEKCVHEEINKQTIERDETKKVKIEGKLPPIIADLEERIRSICGTKVKVTYAEGRGKIEIDYYNNDDLDRIFSIFSKNT